MMQNARGIAAVGCTAVAVVIVGLAATAVVNVFGMFLDVVGPDLVVALLVTIGTILAGIIILRGMAWVAKAWWAADAERERAAVVRQLVYPDAAGLFPIDADRLRSVNGTQLAMQNNMMSHWKVKVEPDVVPKSITYAPHVTYKNQGSDGAQVDPPRLLEALDVQSISQLWASNALPNSGFLVGYDLDTQKPVTADWRKLYSALIGGQSGSGKSTLIRSLLAQSALQGGKFVIIDPHYGAGEESLGASLESLRGMMLCDVAADDNQIREALAFVDGVGQRRLKGLDRDRTPLVLVVDETTALLQRGAVADALTNSLAQIAQETRKVGVYAFCIGQNFSGEVLPTVVRNSFVSQLSCRARRDVARVQSGSTTFGKAVENLEIGQCVWMTPRGEMWTLAVPNCTQQDLEAISTRLNGKTTYTVKTPDLHEGSGTSKLLPRHFQSTSDNAEEVGMEVQRKADGSTAEVPTEVDSIRAKRVLAAFIDGDSHNKIAKEIYNVSGGRKYESVKAEIDAILRTHIMKRGNE